MKTAALSLFLLLFFACNKGKQEAAKLQSDSLQIQAQQKQIDSLKKSATATIWRDSIRKSKLTLWRKQMTLLSVSLSADKATLNKAQQPHRNWSRERKKRELKEATVQLAQDKKRMGQVTDSLRKYRN